MFDLVYVCLIPYQFMISVNVPKTVWGWYRVPPASSWVQLKGAHQNPTRVHTPHGFLDTLSYNMQNNAQIWCTEKSKIFPNITVNSKVAQHLYW